MHVPSSHSWFVVQPSPGNWSCYEKRTERTGGAEESPGLHAAFSENRSSELPVWMRSRLSIVVHITFPGHPTRRVLLLQPLHSWAWPEGTEPGGDRVLPTLLKASRIQVPRAGPGSPLPFDGGVGPGGNTASLAYF